MSDIFTQSDPFAMLVESSEKLEGNARFEGISIDVAQELARLLGFNFTIKLVDDGNVRDPITESCVTTLSLLVRE